MKRPQSIKPLSDTEKRVMDLLCDGRRPTEVCLILDRSVSTISTHLKRVNKKLGTKTTIHAAVTWALMREYADAEYKSWLQK